MFRHYPCSINLLYYLLVNYLFVGVKYVFPEKIPDSFGTVALDPCYDPWDKSGMN
jgi:hypothetical protein